ncbi:MAG: ABC transporter ATP-binding protein [Oligoflexus sp.]
MPQELLTVADLKMEYPSSQFHLGPLTFQLEKQRVMAILGQNGAGKSTLFQMLTGNLRPAAGTIHISGQRMLPDRPEVKRMIGYLPQSLQLPHWVNGWELLAYAIKLYGLDQPEERRQAALQYWDCESYQYKPLAACSHGMQKRVGLALATIHNPDLLILDEPFSGLDLYHIRSLQNVIQKRREQGQATILSTHIAPYAAQLCDEVMLIQNGQIHMIKEWQNADLMSRVGMIEGFFFPESRTPS